MLVLSRKPGESLRISDNIEVTVLEVRHGKVRLGFRCPDDVSILRKEVYDRDAADAPSMLSELSMLVET